MKRGHGAPVTGVDALVQAMKKIRPPGPVLPQEPPAAVTRKGVREGPKKPMRAVAIDEVCFRMRHREAVQNLPRVHSHSRQIRTQAIGGIHGDLQSASIAVLARVWALSANSFPSWPSISSKSTSRLPSTLTPEWICALATRPV